MRSDAPYLVDAFAAVIDVWNGGPSQIRSLVTDDYRGHMLHLPGGERTADDYGEWIARYRQAHPGVRFEIVDQVAVDNKVWSRLTARRPDGATAHGLNVSGFVNGQLAEEWALWSAWTDPGANLLA